MKKFQAARIVIPGIIGTAISVGIIRKNFIIPIIIIAVGFAIMYILKTTKTDIQNDERTYKIGSLAARYTISIFIIGALIISIILMTLRTDAAIWAAGQTLSFSVCAILFIYVVLYKYFAKKM